MSSQLSSEERRLFVEKFTTSLQRSRVRESFCPGFQLWLYPRNDLTSSRRLPGTILCSHNPCRKESEYEYYTWERMLRRELTYSQLLNLFPMTWLNWASSRSPSTMAGEPSRDNPNFASINTLSEFPECSGFLLTKGTLEPPPSGKLTSGVDWNPVSMNPFTKPCPHHGHCD